MDGYIFNEDRSSCRCKCMMLKSDTGDWVKYEDHLAEIARLKNDIFQHHALEDSQQQVIKDLQAELARLKKELIIIKEE